ncbi:MAG: FecR domain-containing protein [Myxococcota bacterium]
MNRARCLAHNTVIRVCTLVCMIAGLSGSAEAQAEGGDTFEYTVQAGDSCGRIAHRFYGQWRRYDVILRFNPQFQAGENRGSCGPFLRPGVVLTLPRTLDGIPGPAQAPDAQVTAVRRQVQAREPAETRWQAAQRGLGLYRGWRVNTLEESAAELTFRDASVVQMRENTLVIIYGGEARRSRRRTAQATLERGALRSRLGELRMQVDTPSGQTDLDGGSALVAVDQEGTSRISNFEGGNASLRGRSGGRVRVRPGFGSKVRRGQRPSRPRQLPAAPRWSPETAARFVGIAREGGTLRGSWLPVDGARRYRIEVGRGDPGERIVAATEVSADVQQFEFHRLPAGDYWARLSTIDGDFFESRPSAAHRMNLVLAELRQPGEEAAPDVLPDPSVAPTTPQVLMGTRVLSPDGYRCRVGSSEVLTNEGEQRVRCADDRGSAGEVVVEVVAARVEVVGDIAERGALRRGTEETLTLAIESAVGIPDDLAVRGPGVEMQSLERGESGQLVVALVVQEDAPDPLPLEVVAGDESVATVTLRVENPVEAPDPDPEPEPEPEEVVHPPSYVHDTFGRALHPTLLGLEDERRRGHSLSLTMAHFGDHPGGDGHWRLLAGGELALGTAARLGVSTPVDFATDDPVAQRGNRDVYVFGQYHLLRGIRWGAALDVAAWLPVGSQDDGGIADYRIITSLAVSARVSRFTFRTRQGAIIDIRPEGPRTWASAYGADVRLIGGFAAGLEVDLGIGRDRASDELLTYSGLALGLSLRGGPVSASLGARYSLTNDLQADLGDLALAASLRVSLE